MPNQENIDRPITLVGPGRSGTTLLTNVFRTHSGCESLGETGDVLFSTYYHVHATLPICGPFFASANAETHARGAVHTMLRSLASSDRPHWFHKPIRVLAVRRLFGDDEAFMRWWWDAHAALFPDARIFTVLRDPRDVVASSMTRWSFTREQAVDNLRLLYRWLLHERSRCAFAIRFDELVGDPEASVRHLFERVELPFERACLAAFELAHAPNDGDEGRDTVEAMAARGHAHPDAADLDIGDELPALYAEALERLASPSSSADARSNAPS